MYGCTCIKNRFNEIVWLLSPELSASEIASQKFQLFAWTQFSFSGGHPEISECLSALARAEQLYYLRVSRFD
jgi:hypothetical protein